MEQPPLLTQLLHGEHLGPIDRIVYLGDLRASIREFYNTLGATLQAAVAVVAETDLEEAAKAFGVAPAALVAMAQSPDFPDVALLRSGLQAVRRLPDLSVESICDVSDALTIDGATLTEARVIARLLCQVADQTPLDGPIWADAQAKDRVRFAQAVTYAKSLLASD
ncbi:hypothetical protein [Nonomuraea gerenzanensis]|uniref:Uncharacterized protein n=1 Tax=Nonomuraea gerenzanensis TaxID=93944 RepID=A0A1M4DVN5_9ACTN|nr:hypothetical protein [Nonomuraea gerenzanensis]UBU12962.1 hypothetical protein LCN96_53445 [Nonomuraea gerenzanensis]SBO90601.1 hypothetical protein BN4615_P115 [Nonomuraea gerenzanensis]